MFAASAQSAKTPTTKQFLIPKRRDCWLSAETSGFRSVVAKFAGAPLGFHDLSYFVEMPRLKIM